ncbi:hybrid sensor histidine kinase/response regulator [Noviherbaspirillum malthae]|jgi:signal transduction histidine kinase/CheY-like chemotaxis protein|uniref:hybrid sensor histidine kinase/response regulator n=1 Tax=Noviherbaspirillum malthae TaxID=1260987 RepID=UPI00188E0CB5|nr:ATP-binding protein [Noviherbaspirillum malthae]
MKVRSYLLLLALVILIPVMVFSGLAIARLQNAFHRSSEENQMELARSIALAIDQELTSAKSALRVLAASSFLETEDFAAFYQHAKVANIGETGWVILYDAQGDQVISTRVPYGTPIATTRDRRDVISVLDRAETTASNLFFGQAAKQHVVMLEMPVVLPSGKKYVLSQVFLPTHFHSAFAGREIPKDWLVGIFDRNGTIIGRSHRADKYVGRPVIASMKSAITAEREGMLHHHTSDGVEVLDVFTQSKVSGWTVAVGAPVSVIAKASYQALFLWVGGLLIASVVGISFAAYFSRRLVRAITSSAESAAVLGTGQRPTASKMTRISEVDRLNSAIDDTARLLEEERASRAAVEAERERLLMAEKQARLTADELNQSKDRFLAMLSHELRNPINAITAGISVFELSLDRDATAKAIGVIRRQGLHLRRIVDDLLDVSRALTGRLSLKTQRVDLSLLVANSIAALKAAGKTSEHNLHVSTEHAWVDVDPVRMEQILTNLLDNAIKYTPHGGHIQVLLQAVADDAILTIRDNGIGIAPELLPKIFDVFVQADDSLDRSQGGLGIGLSLVKELIRMHGGTILAESPGLGHGSTFTLRLPVKDVPQEEMLKPETADSSLRGSVLLVEDNDDARELFAMMLESSGYKVLQADNGVDGLRIAAQELPEIAFIDIGLPGMDGFEVAARLKNSPTTGSISLVALSGYGTAHDTERSAKSGFDRHLVKPVKLADLISTIVALQN